MCAVLTPELFCSPTWARYAIISSVLAAAMKLDYDIGCLSRVTLRIYLTPGVGAKSKIVANFASIGCTVACL